MEILNEEIVVQGFQKEFYKYINEKVNTVGQHVVMKFELISAQENLPQLIARKDVPIQRLHGEDMREYKILRECIHQNILILFYWEHVRIEHYEYLHLYTELCDQNLKTFTKENILSLQNIKALSLQMLKGCQYQHDKKVVHRDIKPDNVLVNKGSCPSKAILKLADFGLARPIPNASSVSTSIQMTACGTRHYMSPEMLDAYDNGIGLHSDSAFATDVFSLGVVIFEMVKKKLPFQLNELRDRTRFDLAATMIQVDDGNFTEGLRRMLDWDPKMRPTAKDIQHYFSTNMEIMSAFQHDTVPNLQALSASTCVPNSSPVERFKNDPKTFSNYIDIGYFPPTDDDVGTGYLTPTAISNSPSQLRQ